MARSGGTRAGDNSHWGWFECRAFWQVDDEMSGNSQRVLITGGAGMIGSHLVEALATGEQWRTVGETIVVDNLVNGRRENIAEYLGARICFERVDIRDDRRMAELLRGIDVLFHLACLGVRHSIHSPRENHEVNATATLELLRLAREAGVSRFVYVSSSEVYGTARTVPMSEEHPTFPMTVYGSSKLAGDCYTRAYWETYRYPTVVVRPFNVYGPRCHHEGDSGEVIPKFMLRAMAGRPMIAFGDGTQRRDFTYVGDTAGGILTAGWAADVVGETLNLGSGREVSINELGRLVAEIVARPDARLEHGAPRPGDVLRLLADSSKARRLFGFEATTPMTEGLRKLRDWYRALPQTPEELLQRERERNWEPVQRCD